MGSSVVVFIDEGVDQRLQFGDGGGLGLLGGEPFLECLVEAFDFAAGGGMVRGGVLLLDLEFREPGLEGVAAASELGETCRVDHSVVGEDRGRKPLVETALIEGVDDDVAGGAVVCGDRECVAGVIVEPDQDLGVCSAG